MTLVLIAFENAPRPDAATQKRDAELNAKIKKRFDSTALYCCSHCLIYCTVPFSSVKYSTQVLYTHSQVIMNSSRDYCMSDVLRSTAILASPRPHGKPLDLLDVQLRLRAEPWSNLPPGVGFDGKLAHIARLWHEQHVDPFKGRHSFPIARLRAGSPRRQTLPQESDHYLHTAPPPRVRSPAAVAHSSRRSSKRCAQKHSDAGALPDQQSRPPAAESASASSQSSARHSDHKTHATSASTSGPTFSSTQTSPRQSHASRKIH